MTVDRRTHPLRLAAAAVQPILTGWAIIVILGIFSYTLMADSPALGSTTWQVVAAVSTGWWLTAFGGTLHFDGVAIALPPLTITLLTFLAMFALIRRHAVKDWIDLLIVAASSGIATALIGLLAPAGSNGWEAGLGAAVLSVVPVLASKNRADWFGTGMFTTAPGRAVYDGFILARRATATALALAALGLVTATVLGWSEILKINDYYIVEWHSGLLMWLFQAAYLPTAVIWALAYIIGAGFAVGAGTLFSAFGVTSAPLPAIPILGALPQPGQGAGWVIIIVIAALVLRGIRQARAFPDMVEVLVTGTIQVAATAVIGALLAIIAQGSIGPHRMAVMGPQAAPMALHSAVIIGVPLLVGMILGHRTVVAALRSGVTGIGDSIRNVTRGTASVESLQEPVAPQPHVPSGPGVWPHAPGAAAAVHAVPTSTLEPDIAPTGDELSDADEDPGERGMAPSAVSPEHAHGGPPATAPGDDEDAPTPPTPATAQTAAEPGRDDT